MPEFVRESTKSAKAKTASTKKTKPLQEVPYQAMVHANRNTIRPVKGKKVTWMLFTNHESYACTPIYIYIHIYNGDMEKQGEAQQNPGTSTKSNPAYSAAPATPSQTTFIYIYILHHDKHTQKKQQASIPPNHIQTIQQINTTLVRMWRRGHAPCPRRQLRLGHQLPHLRRARQPHLTQQSTRLWRSHS